MKILLVFLTGNSVCYGLLPLEYVQEMKQKCPHLAPESFTPQCPFYNFGNEGLDSEFPCEPMPMSFAFSPNKLIFFNDRSQSFGVTGFIQIRWYIICRNLPTIPDGAYMYSKVDDWWTPNVAHSNSDSDFEMRNTMKRLFLIPQDENSTGFSMKFSIQYLGLFSSHFDLALENFPFDRQNCSIDFVLQEYHRAYNLTTYESKTRMDNLASPSSTWALLDYDTSCKKSLSSGRTRWVCRIWFEMRRKPDYYITNLMFPSALLSLLEIFAFCIHRGKTNRPAFGLTILLTFAFLKTEILSSIPETSDYSFLGKYNDLCSVFALFCTIYFLLMNWFQRKRFQCFKDWRINMKPALIDKIAMALSIVTLLAINIYAILSVTSFMS